MLASVVHRSAPLQNTLVFATYCGGMTAAFLHLQGGLPAEPGVPLSWAEAVTEHMVANHNLMQGVTGFLASALFLMLSFRLNRSYMRWWEAGNLYANLLSGSRNLALTAQLAITEKAVAAEVGMLGYAYVRAVEFHLRRTGPEAYTEAFRYLLTPRQLEELLAAPQRPLFLAQHLTLRLSRAYDAKQVKNVRLLVSLMADVQGLVRTTQHLQRLQSLPEPWNYQKHLRLTTQLWLGLLPLALVPTLELATPLVTSTIAYVVYKLDDVSVELTNPFGLDRSDLSICLFGDALQREVLALVEGYVRQAHGEEEGRREDAWEVWGGKPPED